MTPDRKTELFNTIDKYIGNIDGLVVELQQVGIYDYQQFKNAVKEAHIPVNKTIEYNLEEKLREQEAEIWEKAKQENTESAYLKYLSLYKEGVYRTDAQKSIEELEREEDDAWDALNKGRVEDIQEYTKKYPKSKYKADATILIKDLMKEQYLGSGIIGLSGQIKKIKTSKHLDPHKTIYKKIVDYINADKITVEELLEAIADDNNFISGSVASMLWENNIITDFSPTGISQDFIAHMVANITPPPFLPARPLVQVSKSSCTEVYFWGIPSSGKTCALGAILSAANSGKVAKSMFRDNDCQGYGYMTRLSNLFRTNNQVGTLPEGTDISSTYEMGFTLRDEHGRDYSITCIDFAGELIRCMYKYDAGEELTNEQEKVLATLTNILVNNRTDNRKIHFFVIEYGGDDRQYEGLSQHEYLDATVAYIKKTGIFEKDTDAIYLLVTKVDKAKATSDEDLEQKLRDYILGNNYEGFYNGLKGICKDAEINGGEVEIIPFTLGKVCFENFCKFNDVTATAVVRRIMSRVPYIPKKGLCSKISNWLKK